MTRTWLRSAGAAVAVLVLLGGTAGQAGAQVGSYGGRDAQRCAAPGAATVVRPFERVGVGQGMVMALIPSSDQKYVLADDTRESFRRAVRDAYQYGGADLADGRISASFSFKWHTPEQEVPNIVFSGAWRADCGPSRITIEFEGGSYEAELLRLPNRPGWGTYHADPGVRSMGNGDLVVTAYDAEGRVLDRMEFRGEQDEPGGPEGPEEGETGGSTAPLS
ncbi:hypothetical protein [Streptomyces marincola]|uniref:hypothetical protein n=1 Tax=Streptomyces marincola TaxID=2878388 RepID=UPI001CF125C5|nr:hypothetical protein [Streptomyces marincola]UCM88979.1 hypothetical protein LC193_14050 [Streptomyces marincola]